MNENSEKVKMRLLRLNTIPEEAKDYSVNLLLETADQLKTFVLQYDDSDSAAIENVLKKIELSVGVLRELQGFLEDIGLTHLIKMC